MNRDNRRLRLVFAILIVTSLTLLTLDLRGGKQGAFGAFRRAVASAFGPVQHGLSHLFTPVGDAFGAAFHAHRDQQQIDALQRELIALRLKDDQDSVLKADAVELTKLAQFNYYTSTIGVPASVIAKGGAVDDFQSTDTLDIGSVDKIEVGLPVIDPSGLIGTVLTVTAHNCVVKLIDDPSSNVGVDDAKGGLIAYVSGRGAGQSLAYDQIQPAGQLPSTGTEMFTAETSSYLKGLPVGTVGNVSVSGTDEVGFLTPYANVDGAKVVEVVLSQQSDAARAPLVPESPPPTTASPATSTSSPAVPGKPSVSGTPAGSASPGPSVTPAATATYVYVPPVQPTPVVRRSPSAGATATGKPAGATKPTATKTATKATAKPAAKASTKPGATNTKPGATTTKGPGA